MAGGAGKRTRTPAAGDGGGPPAPPPAPVQADELSWALRATQRAYDELNAALARRMAMNPTDLAALDVLAEDGPTGPAELAHRLGIRTASATALVDRLEAAGHARRTRHPTDRRRLSVEMTDEAMQLVWTHIEPVSRRLDAIAARLAPDERRVVLAYLAEVCEAVRASARDGDEGARDPDGAADAR